MKNKTYSELMNEIADMIVEKYGREEILYLIECMDSDPNDTLLDLIEDKLEVDDSDAYCHCEVCERFGTY